MKLMLSAIFTFAIVHLMAQSAPQKMSYQAVARNSSGVTLNNQSIRVKADILEADLTTVLYAETHTTTTNQFGLFTLQIGTGTIVSGTFANINWGVGDKFIRTSADLTGGTNYQLLGTSQLLTVPYAFYAEKTKLVAGTGISITNGNTINATASGSQWNNEVNGINYTAGKVGIGTTANNIIPLSVFKPNSNQGQLIAQFRSNDTWHSAISISNTTATKDYFLIVGGSNNIELKPNNFGIFNGKWPLTINGTNNFIGVGDTTLFPTEPKSTMHLKTGDVYIEQITKGIIMKSPNGNCWRVTVDDSGNLVRTQITCP